MISNFTQFLAVVVYRAEVGFYDSYDINREKYSNPNLQKIDDSTESYYLNGVDYYIYN